MSEMYAAAAADWSVASRCLGRSVLLGNLQGFLGSLESVSLDSNTSLRSYSEKGTCWSKLFPAIKVDPNIRMGGLARRGFTVTRRHLEAEKFTSELSQRSVMEEMQLKLALETGHTVVDDDPFDDIPPVILINDHDKYVAGLVALLSLGLFVLLIAWHFHEPADDTHESKLVKYNAHMLGYAFGVSR